MAQKPFNPMGVKKLSPKAGIWDLIVEGAFEIQAGRGLNFAMWASLQLLMYAILTPAGAELANHGIKMAKNMQAQAPIMTPQSKWIAAIQYVNVQNILTQNAADFGQSFAGSIVIYFKDRKQKVVITPPIYSEQVFEAFKKAKSIGEFYIDNIAFSRGGKKFTNEVIGIGTKKGIMAWSNLATIGVRQGGIMAKMGISKTLRDNPISTMDIETFHRLQALQKRVDDTTKLVNKINRVVKWSKRVKRTVQNPQSMVKNVARRKAGEMSPMVKKSLSTTTKVSRLANNNTGLVKRKARMTAKRMVKKPGSSKATFRSATGMNKIKKYTK